MPDPLDALRVWLDQQGEAPDPLDLGALLAEGWRLLADGREGGMHAGKLYGRVEEPSWRPPVLTFLIERHGGAALGSSRAELQEWSVDLDARTASLRAGRWRALLPARKGLKVDALAVAIRDLVAAGARNDPRLTWLSAGMFRVNVAKITPLATGSAVKMTLSGRRKRFKAALAAELEPLGWQPDETAAGSTVGYRFVRAPPEAAVPAVDP